MKKVSHIDNPKNNSTSKQDKGCKKRTSKLEIPRRSAPPIGSRSPSPPSREVPPPRPPRVPVPVISIQSSNSMNKSYDSHSPLIADNRSSTCSNRESNCSINSSYSENEFEPPPRNDSLFLSDSQLDPDSKETLNEEGYLDMSKV